MAPPNKRQIARKKAHQAIRDNAAARKRRKSMGKCTFFQTSREKYLESADTSLDSSFGASGLTLDDSMSGTVQYQLIAWFYYLFQQLAKLRLNVLSSSRIGF